MALQSVATESSVSLSTTNDVGVEHELSTFGTFRPGQRAFEVVRGFDSDDAANFTGCITDFLRQSMDRGVESGGVPPSEAWVNSLLLEMIDAVSYVDEKQKHVGGVAS